MPILGWSTTTFLLPAINTLFSQYVPKDIMTTSAHDDNLSAKRKRPSNAPRDSDAKRTRIKDAQPPTSALIKPHEKVMAELSPKNDVLALSVISSTQIRKRIASVTKHLLAETEKPRVVLLHARTADVCKLITVVEQCKRVLGEEGKTWYQYNQLYDVPEGRKKRDIVEDTILRNEVDEDSDSDDFEVMNSRFEDAVLPPPTDRTIKSLRVFVSITPIPELKSNPTITLQRAQEGKSV